MLPLNIVMPAVKSDAAIVLWGATAAVRRRAVECMSWRISVCVVQGSNYSDYRGAGN